MTPNLLDELEKIVALSEKATPGKVELHTSCSWRRIVAESGRPFLVPGIDPDRHPNMDTTESARFVVALVNWFRTRAPALADMAKRLEAAERDAALLAAAEYRAEKAVGGHGVRFELRFDPLVVHTGSLREYLQHAIDATQEGEAS